MESYRPRLLDEELAEVLTSHPAVLVVGPRACGKTTTTRRQCRSALRLDVPAQAAVVRADPDAALRDLPDPILIDEWQLAPDILGAVKRAVDDDPRPGRFVLTGSSQADLTATGWPATGRRAGTWSGGRCGRSPAILWRGGRPGRSRSGRTGRVGGRRRRRV